MAKITSGGMSETTIGNEKTFSWSDLFAWLKKLFKKEEK